MSHRVKSGRNSGGSAGKTRGTPTRDEVDALISLHRAGRAQELIEAAERFTRRWSRLAFGWNVLAEARRMNGDLQASEKACERAARVEPRNAEARNNLGNTLRDAGRLEEAVAAYSKAVRLKPELGPAHFNLGHVLRDLGRFGEAVDAYRQAESLEPGASRISFNLGVVLRMAGRLDEAETAYRRALALRPDYPEAHYNLGNLLSDTNRLDEAEIEYRRALEPRPEYAAAHNNLAKVMIALGRFDEAACECRSTLAFEPDNPRACLHLAEARRFRPGDPDLALIERALAHGDLPDDGLAHVHYAVAKAYADIGESAGRVFESYAKGARLWRSTLTYDVADDERLFEAIAAAFPADAAGESRDRGDPTSTPVFIVGMPRSGTSLVEQILASHPRVHGAGERSDLDQLVDATGQVEGRPFPAWVEAAPAATFADLGGRYRAAVIDPAGEVARVTDKMPGNFRYLGLIRDMLPNARVIHVSRDPVDTCLSCFMHLFAGVHAYSYDLSELGRYYRAYAGLMAHWRRVLPGDFLHEVRYEELVSDPGSQVARLLDHCGLEWDAACLDFHRSERAVRTVSATQVRRPMYRSSIGRWKPYREHLQPLFEALGDLAPDG